MSTDTLALVLALLVILLLAARMRKRQHLRPPARPAEAGRPGTPG
jgi:hypothetical protein